MIARRRLHNTKFQNIITKLNRSQMKPKTIVQFQIESERERDKKGLRVKVGVRGN